MVRGGQAKLVPVKLDPQNPVLLAGAGRTGANRQGVLVAVPKGTEKNYESDEKFHLAIKNRTVGGMVESKWIFDSQVIVPDADPRTVVVDEYVVEKIDKDGISLYRRRTDEPKEEQGAPGEAPREVSPETSRAVFIVSLAVALALLSGGLWLFVRARLR